MQHPHLRETYLGYTSSAVCSLCDKVNAQPWQLCSRYQLRNCKTWLTFTLMVSSLVLHWWIHREINILEMLCTSDGPGLCGRSPSATTIRTTTQFSYFSPPCEFHRNSLLFSLEWELFTLGRVCSFFCIACCSFTYNNYTNKNCFE